MGYEVMYMYCIFIFTYSTLNQFNQLNHMFGMWFLENCPLYPFSVKGVSFKARKTSTFILTMEQIIVSCTRILLMNT